MLLLGVDLEALLSAHVQLHVLDTRVDQLPAGRHLVGKAVVIIQHEARESIPSSRPATSGRGALTKDCAIDTNVVSETKDN